MALIVPVGSRHRLPTGQTHLLLSRAKPRPHAGYTSRWTRTDTWPLRKRHPALHFSQCLNCSRHSCMFHTHSVNTFVLLKGKGSEVQSWTGPVLHYNSAILLYVAKGVVQYIHPVTLFLCVCLAFRWSIIKFEPEKLTFEVEQERTELMCASELFYINSARSSGRMCKSCTPLQQIIIWSQKTPMTFSTSNTAANTSFISAVFLPPYTKTKI